MGFIASQKVSFCGSPITQRMMSMSETVSKGKYRVWVKSRQEGCGFVLHPSDALAAPV
jgi:hypothetical protein